MMAGTRGRVGLGLAVLALATLPWWPLSAYAVTLLVYTGLSGLVAMGLVLLTGVSGLTSFGQAAFVGIGAYTAGYLTVGWGLSPWLALPAALALTGVSALLIGAITVRMSGHFLPLATIAWGLSLYFLFGNLDFLGKYDGLSGLPVLTAFGVSFGDQRAMAVLVWTTVLLTSLGLRNLLDSRPGRAIRALHGASAMAEAMGVNTGRARTVVFVLAALLAGLSGWLYAFVQRAVSPSPFGLNHGIEYLFMAVLGGVGHVAGGIVGAAVVTGLKEVAQQALPSQWNTGGSVELIAFGLLLVVMLQRAPDGLWAIVARRWRPAPGAMPVPVPKPRSPVPRPPQTPHPVPGEWVLDVQGVRKEFGGLVAVAGLDLQVRAGELVGLIGPNGAGKSTTFDLITGVARLTRGQVMLRGQPVAGLPAREIVARGIARTFQHVQLVAGMSVLDNVAIGAHRHGRFRPNGGVLASVLRLNRREETELRAEAAHQLRRVGLGDVMFRDATSLALGQQRLVEIARALCCKPVLLLLDEPAAGLRLQEKDRLAGMLRELKTEGIAVLLVEHDMGFVMSLADRLVVMDFGTRIAAGVPEAVQQDPRVIEAYLGGEEVTG